MALYRYIPILCFTPAILASQNLPEVIVRAKAPRAPSSEAGEIVLTEKDFNRKQARDIPDALRSMPELAVSQSGGAGHKTSIFMRGLEARHTLLFQDGMRMDSPAVSDGAVDFGPLSLDGVSKLKIIRGPSSALYGSDALAGVIVLKTQKGKGDPQLSGLIEAGSFRTNREIASLKGRLNRFNYNVTTSRLQTAGSSLTPDRRLYLIQGPRHDRFMADNIVSRLGVDLTESTALALFSQYRNSRLGYRTWGDFRQEYTDQENWGHRLQVTSTPKESMKYKIGLAQTQTLSHDSDQAGLPKSSGVGKRTRLDARWRWDVTKTYQITLAGDASQQQMTTAYGSDSQHARMTQAGVGMRHRYKPIDKLTLDFALRGDRITRYHAPLTWRGQVNYDFTPQTGIRASYGTAFKAPILYQLYAQTQWTDPNPRLKPEKGQGGDISLVHKLFQNQLEFQATYFWNRVHNLILSVRRAGKYRYINVDAIQSDGLRLSAKVKTRQGYLASASYTYTHAINSKTKNCLLRRPRHKLTLDMGYDFDPWEANVGVIINSGQWDVDWLTSARKRMNGYAVVTATAAYKLSKRTELFARAENAFNRRYEDPDGYQRPGLGVYAGLKVSL